MRFYRNPKSEIPCLEWMIKTELATHFFIDPAEKQPLLLDSVSMIGEPEDFDDSEYVGISETLVPDDIKSQLMKKERQVVDQIKENKIVEVYEKIKEKERK